MTKICTDLNQSKELAEILPLDSADMFYPNAPVSVPCIDDGRAKGDVFIPCWSLSALLEILKPTLDVSDDGHCRLLYRNNVILFTEWYESGIDACVALIKRLKEMELI